jgi:hypothetical protein
MSSIEFQTRPSAALTPAQSLACIPLSMSKAEQTNELSTTHSPEHGVRKGNRESRTSSNFPEFTSRGSNTAFKPQRTLSALCELCKSDFVLEKNGVERASKGELLGGVTVSLTDRTIKQIDTYARSGCHLCSMLWAEIQRHHSWSVIDDNDVCHLYLTGRYERQSVLNRDWKHSICLSLCPVTKSTEQTNLREPQWIIESTKTPGGLQKMSVQLLSLDNIDHRTIPQIRNWLQTCQREHMRCKTAHLSEPIHNVGTFRLIHIGTKSNPKVHLSSTEDMESWPKYTTLSHRWTSATRTTRLLWSNIEKYFVDIDTDMWPAVYKQALYVTREIEVRYLWVDSICIVQDSKDDWTEQSSLMDYIYARGVLNLAADSDGSFNGFGMDRDLLTESPCIITRQHEGTSSETVNSYYLCYREDYLSSAISSAPLAQRGWVFQERILSTRAVHFGPQLFWECATLEACETFPTGNDLRKSTFINRSTCLTQSMKADLMSGMLQPSYDQHFAWSRIVIAYTQTLLSVWSDRLVALNGVVNAFARQYDIPTTSYLAGMWEASLPESLLWTRVSIQKDEHRDNLLRHFPSWSWASISGPVHNSTIYSARHTALVKVKLMQAPNNKLGSLAPAQLVLHGWTFTMEKPPYISSRAEEIKRSTKYKRRWVFQNLSWGDTNIPIGPNLTLLPICQDGSYVRGLLIQRIEDQSDIPTYTRLGTYRCLAMHKYLIPPPLHHVGNDLDQSLLTAPVIRLV